MQRVALAERCFAEPGPYQAPAFVTAPALQRTASQELRAALRPGREPLQFHKTASLREAVFFVFDNSPAPLTFINHIETIP
jgi:hypothetical protein